MQTILIAEIKAKDDLGLPRGDLKLNTQIKALYPTPLRKGLAVIYVCQNKVRFSRNRAEENSFDDFKILDGTRQYFRLNYDEVVFNIAWQAPHTDSIDDIHGALATNKRICIVDSNLKALKNIKISSDFTYSFVLSSYWLGKTLLFTTHNHLRYCNVEGESQIVFTYNNSRSVICDAIADRVSIATYDNQDNVVISTRKVHMLEPLIMGELSYAKTEEQIDLKLFKCVLQNLDTEQISKRLISKLMKRKMYYSAWFLLQNSHCPQFSITEKHMCLTKLHKTKELFEIVFGPNKDVINNKHDLSEAISKLNKDDLHTLERDILKNLHKEFSKEMRFDYALKCAEITGNHSQAAETLFILSQINSNNPEELSKLQSKLGKEFSKDTQRLIEIIDFGKNLDTKTSVCEMVTAFNDGAKSPWDIDFSLSTDIDIDTVSSLKSGEVFDTDISSLNRVDLGFDKQAFSYQVNVTKNDEEKENMPSVTNDTIEHFIGFGSLDTAGTSNEPANEMMGEDTRRDNEDYEDPLDADEAYENIEDVKYLMVLWRFDQGGGAKIMDLSENKNNGNILRGGAMLSNEDAAGIWEAGELSPGEPLDFEDEWGKSAPPNWALTFSGNEALRTRGSKNLSKLKGHFTFQVWLKIDEFKEFILFKRQAEDFNVRFKEPGLIEVSREHNIRNILSFQLLEKIKQEEWVHVSIIYRQIQPDEQENDNCGLKILFNGSIVYEDSKLNFKKPLLETDGLIFLDGYTGCFTELRFWNINLSQNIIQQTYKRPLD